MAHGGMSPRGGLSGVSADADARWEGEPAPSTDASGDASSGVRVTLADSTRAHVLRAFLREHRERRVSRGETAPSSVDALLDSMESARRETSETSSLARDGEGPPARVSDDVALPPGTLEDSRGAVRIVARTHVRAAQSIVARVVVVVVVVVVVARRPPLARAPPAALALALATTATVPPARARPDARRCYPRRSLERAVAVASWMLE